MKFNMMIIYLHITCVPDPDPATFQKFLALEGKRKKYLAGCRSAQEQLLLVVSDQQVVVPFNPEC